MSPGASTRLFATWLMALALSFAVPAANEPDEEALQKERKLLLKVEQIEVERGIASSLVIQPLLDLGLLYIQQARCSDAIAALDRSLKVSRAVEGLFNAGQMQLLEPMLECYLRLGYDTDFAREQEYSLLVLEKNHDRNDPAMVPALVRIAQWYEEGGCYVSARRLYARAIELVRKSAGKDDAQMIAALRGMARAYRLEYVFGLSALDDEENRSSEFRSTARLESPYTRLDRLGELSLLRAVKILRAAGEDSRDDLITALVELGDWYLMGERRREAVASYGQAWIESAVSGSDASLRFKQPEPVLFRTEMGIALRRPPPDREGFNHYWADLDYTVDKEGRVVDVKVGETNAPKALQWRLVDSMRNTRFRPRFVNGAAVDTPHLTHRQGMWVEKWKWKVN